MIGVIKIGKWRPFTARQVIRLGHGYVWEAKVPLGFTFISGFDQYLDGHGEMNWKLHGLLKVIGFKNADVSRSAEGRFACEQILLPSSFCSKSVKWGESNGRVQASINGKSVESITDLGLAESGRLDTMSVNRWGNPDGGDYKMLTFGGTMEDEKTFGGYTIPTRMRVGWHYGTDSLEKGEFFRAEITHAEFH